MSKKMMKRSLALGALMAFVITGSAMAAEKFDSFDRTEKNPVNGSDWALKYDETNDVTSVSGDRSYKYVVNAGQHGDNNYSASIVLGQSYKTGGTNLTFENNLEVYQQTNSGRNLTGSGAAKGIDIYNGTFTVDGTTKVDVHSVNNANGTSINVVGITAWGYGTTTTGNDNSAKLVFKDDVTVNVSNVADELGYKVWNNKTYNNDVPGKAIGISINEDASLSVSENSTLTVTAIGKAETGVGATATALSVTAGEAEVKGQAVLTATSKVGQSYGINVNSDGYTATSGHFDSDAQVVLAGDATINVTGGERAVGVYAEEGSDAVSATLTGEHINITATAKELARGVVAKNSDIVLGGDNSNIKIRIIASAN